MVSGTRWRYDGYERYMYSNTGGYGMHDVDERTVAVAAPPPAVLPSSRRIASAALARHGHVGDGQGYCA